MTPYPRMPASPSTLFAAAVSQAQQGQFDAADRTLGELLDIAGPDARTLSMRGAVRLEMGQAQAALACFDAAIERGGEAASVHVNRGIALAHLGRLPEAIASLDAAIARDGSSAIAHSNLASLLNRLDRDEEALASADRALALEPALASAWAHRGAALYGLERFEEASATFRNALERAAPSGRADRLADIGMSLAALQRYDEAMAAFDAAIACAPEHPLPHYRRAHARLVRREFAGGWDDYEYRWRTPLFIETSSGWISPAIRARLATNPTRQGLQGRVLAIAEQGIGDEIMFASVLPDLMAAARHVTCVVHPRLVRLMSASFPKAEIVDASQLGDLDLDLDGYDSVVALGSLPHAFRRDASDFPGTPYLAPPPSVVAAWRDRLGPPRTRLRVGLSWRGGLKRTGAAARSMPLDALMPLLERTDCEFVSLQYGAVAEELAATNARLDRPIVGFAVAETHDFADLAGLIGALDAVVTVQTAVAHLTGALGAPGFVMIPERPEWRYGTAGAHMPWYRSLTLLRQHPGQGWPPVVRNVGAALDALAEADPQ